MKDNKNIDTERVRTYSPKEFKYPLNTIYCGDNSCENNDEYERLYDWKTLNLESQDIILCAGNSDMSRAIQTFQKYTGADSASRQISHVAGIRKTGKHTLLQESTTLNKWCGTEGVQENDFAEWLKYYDGKVYAKRLKFHRSLSFMHRDLEFWTEHKDDLYESGIPGKMELLLCGLRLNRFVASILPDYTPKFTDEPHCTELQAMRIIKHKLEAKDVTLTCNRMPPHVWWKDIDRWLGVPVDKARRIK